MKALVGAFNQEKALVGAFSVIVQPVVEPMDRFAALLTLLYFSVLSITFSVLMSGEQPGLESWWRIPGGGEQQGRC